MNDPTYQICKGCGNSFTGNFCNQCGQKVIDRFSLKYLWRLLHADLLEVDRGWWRTFKDLTLRPGPTIEGYLKGNTKKYFSPVKYLLIISSIAYVLITVESIFHDQQSANPFDFQVWKAKVISNEVAAFSLASFQEINSLFPSVMNGYMAFYFLFMLPFAAFAGTFVFKNLNFTELLITWIYLWAHILYLMLGLTSIVIPVILIDSESMIAFAILMTLSGLVMLYLFTKTFRYLNHGKWALTFIKIIFSMYGGFFTFFGLLWLILGMVKVFYS
jgi:hypothetical protein